MLRFRTRFSVVFRLGIVLACVVWFMAVLRYSPANAAEPPVAQAASPETQAGKSPDVSWQSVVKMFAAALTICVTAFATAHTQRHIGTAGVGALAENPKLFGNILIYLVVPETMVILGFVIAALILL